MVRAAMVSGLLLALLLTADDGGSAAVSSSLRPNLLRTARVSRADGAPMAALLADGVASTDGDVWDNPRSAILKAGGAVEWELEQLEPIAALRIQADNNDRYIVSGSLDGATWFPIWVAQPVDLPGVQTRTSPELQARAEAHAHRVLEELGYVGVLAIELFHVDGELVVNEMAPRVHNSGHWTIEGAETSQFENHVRAVLGLPLGSTAMVGVSAMLNVLGAMPSRAAVLAIPGAHLHDYGKAPAPNRKIGHVTVRAANASELEARVAAVEATIAAATA